jgi:hypothetical protein
MTFTLDTLAQALRGMPRDARMLIQLPDGALAEIDHVRPGHVGMRDDGTLETRQSTQGAHYGIVLVPKIDPAW